ncbi:MAG: putative unusual protein kinase regulating ubiquinone biosynthesis (AarF/ABC1/UbiB family) [Candidatus Azotimanducaceae bacterium]|jgi:predicted unusual protein kinase regulating ubiquinone biosynthesis (AarF/ABC1/UbiB family)
MAIGVAGNMAANSVAQWAKGQNPSVRDLMLTPSNIFRITRQLAQMRGAAMKLGQLISMDTGDFMPPELAQIMARLREDADSMPSSQLKQVLAKQWSDNWPASFKYFDMRSIAAASIGQVHRAQLIDGRSLAIKVQYPGVARSIDSDVQNIGVLIKLSGLLPKGFELTPYLREVRDQLHEETNYAIEAAHLRRFHTLLADVPHFILPRIHEDWSTPSILAMEYVGGISIEEVAALSKEERDQVAKHLIVLTLKELFEFGVMQTDPNFANYRYQPDTRRIVLLDFGATREIAPTIVDQYRQLIRAGLLDDDGALMELAQRIGFFGAQTSSAHRGQILKVMRLVFEALTAQENFEFSDKTIVKQLQADGLALIEDGFIPPPLPIELMLLHRKIAGTFLICSQLSASVDVAALLRPYALKQTNTKQSNCIK